MRTAHRTAAHHKREMLPHFWRKPITSDQMIDCKLAHWTTIDQFTSGRATSTELWDLVLNGFMYAELMRLLEESSPGRFTEEAKAAIAEHVDTFDGVIERYRNTGRAGFNSTQLLAARAAAEVMDQLIEMDRYGFAVRAAEYSQATVNSIRQTKETT